MSDDVDEDFDLNSLNDEELVEQVHDDLYNGLKDEVEEATRIFLARGWAADRVLNDALVEGMRIVGIDFRDGILFVPEVLLAANAMKAGHGDPAAAARRDRRRADRQDGDRHGQGRHPRHRQEPRRDDDGRRGLRGDRPRHQQSGREVPGGAGDAQARHPRHVGAAHDHHAVHEGRDRHDEGKGHPRRLHRAGRRCAAERGLRQGGRRGRLLPRRRDRRRDGQVADRHAPRRPRRGRRRLNPMGGDATVLVIACGALAREIVALRRANGWLHLDVQCLPAELHNTPQRITAAVREKIRANRDRYATILVAYGDCGTGGAAGRDARAGERRAHSGRALLRVLRRREGLRGPRGRRAGHVLPDGLPAASLRPPGDPRPRPRPPPGARRSVFRQLPAARLSGPTAVARANRRRPCRSRQRLGLAFDWRDTGYGDLERSLRAVNVGEPAWQS